MSYYNSHEHWRREGRHNEQSPVHLINAIDLILNADFHWEMELQRQHTTRVTIVIQKTRVTIVIQKTRVMIVIQKTRVMIVIQKLLFTIRVEI